TLKPYLNGTLQVDSDENSIRICEILGGGGGGGILSLYDEFNDTYLVSEILYAMYNE
ncbi:hypothetical protein ACJX0J_031838, partial [Zea mays]